jgi:2-aminoethylphosphonate transport system ATP-binding protein
LSLFAGTSEETAVSTTVSGITKASSVAFEGVTVAYRGTVVLKPLNLEVTAGEILALIGPSGSGKTTALRAVAGFVKPTSGCIRIGGVDVTDRPPYERGLAMVVQNYALFPHMRVYDNVAFGLAARRAPKALIEERVAASLRTVGMANYAQRFPRELSGGQQQRIAIARALAVRPRVLLLDEPLSALDAQIRRAMVEEIGALHRDLPDITVLYVTHDQSEALTLADRIAIMKDGELAAVGSTHELYRRPPNRFAAEFLGRANILPVALDEGEPINGLIGARIGETRIIASAFRRPRGQALLCVRPQHVSLRPESDQSNRVPGRVKEILWQGELTHLVVEVAGGAMRVVATRPSRAIAREDLIELYFAADDASILSEGAGD